MFSPPFKWGSHLKAVILNLGFPSDSVVKNPPANIAGVKVKVAASYLTLCDSMDYTGILQARILEWILQKTWIQSLGWEDPLEKEMAIHSSILAWRIPRTEELAGYSPWGYKESDTTEGT